MNTYRIRYRKGEAGIKFVKADSVCGFETGSCSYLFKRENEIVAAIPKAVVASVEMVKGDEPEE